MKKILAIALAVLLVVGCIAAAGCTSSPEQDMSKAILGTWVGEKTIPLAGTISLSGTFSEDNTGSLALSLSSELLGTFSKAIDITWSYVSSNNFQATVFGYPIEIAINGTSMDLKVNAYKMQIIDSILVDKDITFTLTKQI